jgi:hypothetical protein
MLCISACVCIRGVPEGQIRLIVTTEVVIGAVNASDGTYSPGGPFCYAGGRLQALSVGMKYSF